MRKSILIAEDEPSIAIGLADELTDEGYDVQVAEDGMAAESLAISERYDLILLDIMLPRKDGFSVCRSIRASGLKIPIIMLTARENESDKIKGLDLGADDYVTKPFHAGELLARIRAAFRRVEEPPGAEVVQVGAVRIDFKKCETVCDGVPISLTGTEYKILQVLAENRGNVVPVHHLMERVWDDSVHVSERTIYTHINNLRSKLERDPSKPRVLISLRGKGYRLRD